MIKSGILLLIAGLGYFFYSLYNSIPRGFPYINDASVPKSLPGESILAPITIGVIIFGLILLILGLIDHFKDKPTDIDTKTNLK